MHGFSVGYAFLINAEVDSMGGVVDGAVGISTKSSPRRVVIEKAQAELRLEYDVREECRRELEFLEKGGNPLDFKFGIAASVSVHSTSHPDQDPDPFLTSEAKGSFASTALPHGDSVGSSGRLGIATACELNSTDNFNGENELLERERKSIHPEHSSQNEGSQPNKASPVFHPKKGQAYIRRNRSSTNRDGPQLCSVAVPSRGSHDQLQNRSLKAGEVRVTGSNEEFESGKMNGDGKYTHSDGPIVDAVLTMNALESESSFFRNGIYVDGHGNIDGELCTNSKNVNSNEAVKEDKLLLNGKKLSKEQKMLRAKLVINGLEGEVNNHFETNSDIPSSQLENLTPQEFDRTDLCATPPVTLPQTCENQHKEVDKGHEDRILEEAEIVEAKHKRIAELYNGLLLREYWQKSHWDFVLEEMTWLANDFAQERLWKMTAAAQICQFAAFASSSRLKEQNICYKQKSVAHNLARAVMAFWHSVKLLVEKVNGFRSEKYMNDEEIDVLLSSDSKDGCADKDKVFEEKLQSHERKPKLALRKYAIRFLQSTCFFAPPVHTEVHEMPDVGSDICLPEYSQRDQFIENFLYVVPFGAMETYRKSIESCLTDAEKTGNSMQEVVTSMYYATTGKIIYYTGGALDTRRPSKKKRKNTNSYATGSHYCMDTTNKTPRSVIIGKSSNNINIGPIPTKKMRTTSRQRAVSSFNVSSGDTYSSQDDQTTLHGGPVQPRGSEVDSVMEFEKRWFMFDSIELLEKPKKKKKIKRRGSQFDQRWQVVSAMANEQVNLLGLQEVKDHVRKREGYQFDSNGNSGLFWQHSKKPKMTKHSLDGSFDNSLPMSVSVSSQMSNMSNQSKIVKLIGGRYRSKKAKTVKMLAGQLGSPWSLFEDQALVVLVHDMGPNWELVSDAINSTLQFKCVFRKSQECKERHRVLMDRSCSDGANSAEDSGSSQPYPSTLPGIPKGSARQLFQRLQEPVEEDTIKSHFEKLIFIGEQLHYRRKQIIDPDMKQVGSVHGSHVVALSQVFPNNVNGGTLTPLDLGDVSSNQDPVSLGYQGTHSGGLGLPNQGGIPSIHPPLNSSFQAAHGSPTMGVTNNTTSTSQYNNPRDARLGC